MLTITGLTSTNRIKTVRDAADTILELGGSYTPVGNWTNMQLITPTLGVASATTINKVALTAPATGSTLTILDGKTLTANNSITLAGTDATTMTFPTTSANVGFREVPSNAQSADYGIVLTDSGKSIDHPASDANDRTFTLPADGTISFPVGACVSFSNMSVNDLDIAITSDTMYLAGAGTTGTRTLAQYGTATARKLTSTTWIIS